MQPSHLVNHIFYKPPVEVSINECDAVTRYSKQHRIAVLIKELAEKGPLIGLGQMGPDVYKTAPAKLDTVDGEDIYGWEHGAKPINAEQRSVIIVGAEKTATHEYVYFILSDDITNEKTCFRTHRPSTTDRKIYVMPHATFRNYLSELYPPRTSLEISEESAKADGALSDSQQEYVTKLALVALEAILDDREQECRNIGQAIFDKYKAEADGNSLAGKQAAVNICDALVNVTSDGKLRRQYIERCWNGIGDKSWTWDGLRGQIPNDVQPT